MMKGGPHAQRAAAKRSHPTSEVRDGCREEIPHTPSPRPGAAGRRSYPTPLNPRPGATGKRSYPTHPLPRTGAAARRSNPMSKEQCVGGCRRA